MADGGRILIADDEETVLGSTAALLEMQGFVCDTVRTSREALAKLSDNQYDVLIADWKMPGNAELELVGKLPTVAAGMPVILVTGYPKLNTVIQRVQAEVYAHLMKPFEFDELLGIVRTAIAQSGQHRSLPNP
jgi:DNA-binding NtrC family response regulator